MSEALSLTSTWPVDGVAAAVLVDGRTAATVGDTGRVFRLASLSKPIAAWAVLVAVEEGIVSLDDVVAPDVNDATLRHLLAHAGGYPFDGPDPIADPGRRRIYSNTGIEVAADHVAHAADMSFEEYLHLGVLDRLAMGSTRLDGSPAHSMSSNVDDVATFLAEVGSPTLVSVETAHDATRPHFPTLGGIVPGVGRFDTCPWGLGFEIRGEKSPHWTGAHNSTATFGHFGGAGTMMWLDPSPNDSPTVGLVALTDRPFDQWADTALRSWSELSDAVLHEFAGAAGAS